MTVILLRRHLACCASAPSRQWIRVGAVWLILSELLSQTNTVVSAFLVSPRSRPLLVVPAPIRQLTAASNDSEESSSDESMDWRSFRAKLVMSERQQEQGAAHEDDDVVGGIDEDDDEDDKDGIGSLFATSSFEKASYGDGESTSSAHASSSSSSTTAWAYESGNVIEQGAVILGGVEQDFGFGLRQQYFHKAAILVLDHGPTFTKGIILNRPTDHRLILEDGDDDDDNNDDGDSSKSATNKKNSEWRVWFGGDVEGLDSNNPDFCCLHSICGNDKVREASVTVMNDIQWTSLPNAKKLVRAGHAAVSDFWVFCGYAGWGPGQLLGELENKSWYMVATDSQTLLQELARQGETADHREAGLDTWTLLMNMIGKRETAEEYTGDFDDLMLKEWALKHLVSPSAGGGVLSQTIDKFLSRLSSNVKVGDIVRASGASRSPFLLEDQELHKSLILIVSDDESRSVGVILNRPSSKGVNILFKGKEDSRQVNLPVRYGGHYALSTDELILWLHSDPVLREANIGTPLGATDGVWKCAADDITTAVKRGLATPEQFVAIIGVTVWPKSKSRKLNGIKGQVANGKFEVVASDRKDMVWSALLEQSILTNTTIISSLHQANEAWEAATEENGRTTAGNELESKYPPIAGLGLGGDAEAENYVFKSDVKVSKLSDDALQSWLATYLLGTPTLGA